MARELRYKDLVEILSTKCYVAEVTAERLLENLVLLIASELQNNSYIKIKNIGKFSVEQKGGSDEWIQNEFGTMVKTYIEPFQYINFEPSQNLLDVVNGESVNYLFKKTHTFVYIQTRIITKVATTMASFQKHLSKPHTKHHFKQLKSKASDLNK